jgi:hypothetical protein
MIRHPFGISIVALVCGLSAGPAGAAEDPLEGDLRDLRVGMTVAELPAQDYVDLACGNAGGAPGAVLASWAEFARCPADAAGLHEVTFAFAESPLAELGDRWEGTKVAAAQRDRSGHRLVSRRRSCSASGSWALIAVAQCRSDLLSRA